MIHKVIIPPQSSAKEIGEIESSAMGTPLLGVAEIVARALPQSVQHPASPVVIPSGGRLEGDNKGVFSKAV